ncbi:MAG: hypothetical protein ACLRMJ_04170 [Alistipes finegoldii]
MVALYSGETDEILKRSSPSSTNGNKLVSMTETDSALPELRRASRRGGEGRRLASCISHPLRRPRRRSPWATRWPLSLMQMRGFKSVDFARLHPGEPRAASADDRRERHARPRSARRGARLPRLRR